MFILFFVSGSFAYSGEVKTNFSTCDSLMNISVSKILNLLKSAGIKSTALSVSDNPAQVLIRSKIVAVFGDEVKVFTADYKTADALLSVIIRDLSVNYTADSLDTDKLQRKITVDIIGTVTEKNGRSISSGESPLVYSDTISREDIESIEQGDFAFAKGKIPPAPKTFWESIAVPAVAVGATITGLILLFTVRSK